MRLIFLPRCKKSNKRLTWQTTDYFSQPSSVKMFLKKMERCFSGKKASSGSQTLKFTSVLFYFGKTLYRKKKDILKKKVRKNSPKLRFWYEIRFFGNLFDKGIFITCILWPVYAINQWNNSRKATNFLNF